MCEAVLVVFLNLNSEFSRKQQCLTREVEKAELGNAFLLYLKSSSLIKIGKS